MTEKELSPVFLMRDPEKTDFLKTPDQYTRRVLLCIPDKGIVGMGKRIDRGAEKLVGWRPVERVGNRMATLHEYAKLFGAAYFQDLHLTLQAAVFCAFHEDNSIPDHIQEDMKKVGMGGLEMGWIKMLAAAIEAED